MIDNKQALWLVASVRTPFVPVDGPFAHRDSLALSTPVVQEMMLKWPDRFRGLGSVAVNLAYANLAREVWLEAKLDSHVPTFTTVFEAADMKGIMASVERGLVGEQKRKRLVHAHRREMAFQLIETQAEDLR